MDEYSYFRRQGNVSFYEIERKRERKRVRAKYNQ